MLSKFLRCSQARKAIFFISARARKKIAVLGMLANARKDHSLPLLIKIDNKNKTHLVMFHDSPACMQKLSSKAVSERTNTMKQV